MKLTARKFKSAREDRKARISISALARKYKCSRNEMVRVIQSPSLEHYLIPTLRGRRVSKRVLELQKEINKTYQNIIDRGYQSKLPEQVEMPFDVYSSGDLMKRLIEFENRLNDKLDLIIHYTSATNAVQN